MKFVETKEFATEPRTWNDLKMVNAVVATYYLLFQKKCTND